MVDALLERVSPSGPFTPPLPSEPRGVTLPAGGMLPGSTAVAQWGIVQGAEFPVGSVGFDVTDTAYYGPFPLVGYSGG